MQENNISTFKNMDTSVLAVAIVFAIINIVYTKKVNSQDSIAESPMLYEAQATITSQNKFKNGTFIYGDIEKDRTSLSEITFSE